MAAWLQRPPAPPRTRGHQQARCAGHGLRFAFYGRTSTGRFQDPASSREWQRQNATRVISGRGGIVAEYFDVGYSRALAWHHRPQAAALLDAAADPDRGFDAVVIGEFERAFTTGQARSILAQLQAYGISTWLAEFNGPVDLTDATHQALLLLLGHQAEREILRARRRTTAAMCAQVRTQGRHLGGRPPYGYRMADAGPHPNPQHARWGRRLLRLDPDPETAPHVQWMFQQRLAALSTAGIARSLNALGMPPPSAHDPARNPHRSGTAWTLRTVAAILANPRYTGRQVWNRQHTDHRELRPGEKNSRPPGVKPSRAWNPREQWEVSPPGAHQALVSEATFVAAQHITALAVPDDANPQRYQLTGLVICGLCGRRAEGHWAHGRARYRCRHGYTSASDAQPHRMKTLYVREDQALAEAGGQLAHHLGTTRDAIPVSGVAGQLRGRGIAIVCTSISINLDTGPAQAGQDDPDAQDVADTGQLSLPGISIPQARPAIKNPQRDHPPKRE
ncbi:recombinase family protein [Actinoplanes sp. NPDC048967]|uniref:recombinase family protein n=1 Tax=Actinoplanes sp. NPDC048967 TaxID=3155269 RepID=UPI0033EC622E